MLNNKILNIMCILTLFFIGCEKEATSNIEPENEISSRSSWKIIQQEILDKSCAGCHSVGTSFGSQSGLILTADVAYENLINKEPHNQGAKDDGLELVGTEGLASLYKSYLWEKINAPDKDHFYADHPQYGEIMPLGMDFLTNGQLEFIRQWIVAGAPETGAVSDSSLLQDSLRFADVLFEPLQPPEIGVQYHIGPFDVAPNSELEFFQRSDGDTTGPIYITRYEIMMRPNSHHYILYGFQNYMPSAFVPPKDVMRNLRYPNGGINISTLASMQYHIFGLGTQWRRLDYSLPPGVALYYSNEFGFDHNPHYFNYSDTTILGELYVNVHMIDPSEVEKVARVLQIGDQGFNLPKGEITTVTDEWYSDQKMYVFELFSHAHELNTEFAIEIAGGDRDGELIYVSYDYSHPPVLKLDPPLEINQGEGFRLIATYDNWREYDVSFGFLSTDEMMILFGKYYTD
tara:strand:+ start:1272 stop:2648 length:1377 start_codon:yes stop_codon:yes gene_type:complete